MSARGLLAAASLGLCLIGVGTVTEGVAVPVTAAVGQQELGRVFERQLAANLKARPKGQPHQAAAALPTQGPVARLVVRRLGIRDVILAGDGSHEQLALGPTMIKRGDAASPVTILAAHRDTHFLFIRDLRPGDEVALQSVTGGTARYRVTRLETVRWDTFAYPLNPAKPLLALTTCYPFGGTEYGGPWRRVAWAEEI